MLLRFYTERGRFPRGRSEIPDAAVDYVARQVGVERTEIAFYEWTGRTSKFHRAQIRQALGFRECTVADAESVLVRRHLDPGYLPDLTAAQQRGSAEQPDWTAPACHVGGRGCYQADEVDAATGLAFRAVDPGWLNG